MAGEVERLQELVDKYDNIVFFGGADGGQKLYAGRAQDGHFERSYKDKYEQNWTMNLYAENVSLGSDC